MSLVNVDAGYLVSLDFVSWAREGYNVGTSRPIYDYRALFWGAPALADQFNLAPR